MVKQFSIVGVMPAWPCNLSSVVLCLLLCLGKSSYADITIVSPPDGMTMSDIAVSFKANSTAEGPYHLEVSRDKTFEGGDITRVASPEKGRNTNNAYFFREKGFALAEGTWYWRMAEADKSRWSEIRTVHVDSSLDMKEPQRAISPENPLFHARLRSNICTKPGAAQKLEKIIPSELKDHLVLDHPTTWPSFLNGHTVIDYKGDPYGRLFENTYGLSRVGRDPSREEIIPNTSRYYGIPFLPHRDTPVPQGLRRVNITDVQTDEQARAVFDPLHPPNESAAYAVDLDNTIIVLNTFENHDQPEAYEMTLDNSGVLGMRGEIPLMNYVMGKREVDKSQYWFQLNGHTRGSSLGGRYDLPEYSSKIIFTCQAEPVVEVEQPDAVVRQSWNGDSKEYALEVEHSRGAVNFTLSVPGRSIE